jgi:hypothetical protein
MIWEIISDRECRVIIVSQLQPVGAKAMLGFARRFRKKPKSTQAWMNELREGEIP